MEANKIIITGAATRMGAAIAKSLSGPGVEMIVHYNTSKASAEKLKKDLIKNKILKQEKIGIFNYEIYNSNEFFEFCSNRLDKDNLYFLDNKSKKLLKKKKINLRNKELIKKFD